MSCAICKLGPPSKQFSGKNNLYLNQNFEMSCCSVTLSVPIIVATSLLSICFLLHCPALDCSLLFCLDESLISTPSLQHSCLLISPFKSIFSDVACFCKDYFHISLSVAQKRLVKLFNSTIFTSKFVSHSLLSLSARPMFYSLRSGGDSR